MRTRFIRLQNSDRLLSTAEFFSFFFFFAYLSKYQLVKDTVPWRKLVGVRGILEN
jgi:hypothetical protein